MGLSQVKKYEDLSFARWVAVGNKLGGLANVLGILSGELEVEVREAANTLFDSYGRRIPLPMLSAEVCDPERDLYLEQPMTIIYAERLERLEEMLGAKTGITAGQFQMRTRKLLATIRENPQIVKCLRGVWLPVVLPQLREEDLSTALEEYLGVVEKSYLAEFPERKFLSRRKEKLAGRVSVVANSRHDQLIARMRQEPVVGIYSPNSLQGFSMDASGEQIESLPEQFSLSGLDASVAMIMYPDVLARGCNTPFLNLAALSWGRTDYSFDFGASDDELEFKITSYQGSSSDPDISSGLFFS